MNKTKPQNLKQIKKDTKNLFMEQGFTILLASHV